MSVCVRVCVWAGVRDRGVYHHSGPLVWQHSTAKVSQERPLRRRVPCHTRLSVTIRDRHASVHAESSMPIEDVNHATLAYL